MKLIFEPKRKEYLINGKQPLTLYNLAIAVARELEEMRGLRGVAIKVNEMAYGSAEDAEDRTDEQLLEDLTGDLPQVNKKRKKKSTKE